MALEICERASATDASAKDAARALRREFKYGEPPTQLSAARVCIDSAVCVTIADNETACLQLWALMLRNCSEHFVALCMSRKFLETLEDVVTSPKTNPVVKDRVMEVLGAAAYSQRKSQQRQ